jgi:hypothetical protein
MSTLGLLDVMTMLFLSILLSPCVPTLFNPRLLLDSLVGRPLRAELANVGTCIL